MEQYKDKENSFSYQYARPALTVDALILRYIGNGKEGLEVLLIQRKHPPFENRWALPGGFVEPYENIETAALRELEEETNLSLNQLVQLKAYGDKERDPRGWTVSVVCGKVLSVLEYELGSSLEAKDDAKNVKWFSIVDLPDLAFDHAKIIIECNQILQLSNF